MKKTEKIFLIVIIVFTIIILVILSRKIFARTDLSARCGMLRSRSLPSETVRQEAEEEFGTGESALCNTGFYGKKPEWKLKEKKEKTKELSVEDENE